MAEVNVRRDGMDNPGTTMREARGSVTLEQPWAAAAHRDESGTVPGPALPAAA